jgi:serine/threonine protein kinase
MYGHDDKRKDENTYVDGSTAGRPVGDFKYGDIIGGSYKIKSILGRGGMGVVYRAQHLVVDRDVALKALAPDRINEANWKRFQAEGKAIARLDHPNIVKVYDMGIDERGSLYYVMDLLHGLSLAQYISQKGLPNVGETLEIFGQLSSGLGYAHRQGIVHRDIKPSNIILCPAGGGSNVPVVKIIDYGLVKLLGEADQLVQSHTATGHVLGSPLYMSPEQCMAGQIDQRTDIYSLGCTLFECLTGQPPFHGESVLATALMHQNNEPPTLSKTSPEKTYPENLEQLVNRMLQKQPAQRHQSMAQVSQDLLRIKAGKSVMREPIFASGPLFQIDDSKEEQLEAPDRTTRLPLAWICALGAVVTLFAVWAAVSHFAASKETQTATKDIIGTSLNPDIVTGRTETPDEAHAREIFAKCPEISHGITNNNGTPERVFHFPEVPLGFVFGGDNEQSKQLAQGDVQVPAAEHVTLQLCRGAGELARLYPSVLAKIGPDDIYALEVKEKGGLTDGGTLQYELPLPLLQAIAKWTGLRKIDFYNCKISDEDILALNNFSSMDDLRLRDSVLNGSALAQVKWLKGLTRLDIKGIKDVDAVLPVLAGSQSLRKLVLDTTIPSSDALKSLVSCKNLESLSFKDADMDDEKLAVVCDIGSLRLLNLRGCNITAKSIDNLSKLKQLGELCLLQVVMEDADAATLRHRLPRCKVIFERIRKARIGDY